MLGITRNIHNIIRVYIGRVLRFLKSKFEDANITAAEIDHTALNFCQTEFSVNSIESNIIFGNINFTEKFDLIWCGSLFTHINQKSAIELIQLFHDILIPGGICIFSMHGETSINWIKNKTKTYGLSEDACNELLSSYNDTGYGFANYDNQNGYGISVATKDYIINMANSIGIWDEPIFLECGWDNHHDVYGFKLLAKEDIKQKCVI